MEKLKKFLAGFMVAILLFFNVPAFAASNSNATYKNTYMKLEKSAFSEMLKQIEKSDFRALQKFAKNNTKDISSEVGVEVKLPLIKTRKYVITNNEPYNAKYEDASIKAFVDGEEVANLNMVANGNNISLQIPELFDNYFTVDMGNLKELFSNLELDVDEDEIPTGIYYPCEMREALKLTKNEEKILKDAKKKYSKLLDKEFLKNEFFSKEKSEELDVNGYKYKVDVVKYEISDKDLFNGMKNTWTEFKNDKTLVDLIWTKFEKVYELNKRTNPQLEKITKEEMISTVDEYFEDMEYYGVSGDDYIISKLYYQKNKIIRRDIIEEDREYEYEDTITMYTVKDKNQEYYALVTDDFKLEDKVNRANKDITHNFTATSIRSHYDFVDGEFIVEKKEEENKATLKLSQVNNNEYKYEASIDGNDTIITGTYKKAKITSSEYVSGFEIHIPAEDQGEVAIVIDAKYKKGAKINKINTTKNEKVLNKMSKEEIVGIYENNKDMIMEKLQGKFGTAFYYDVYMQAMAGIESRMQVRADKATAAQIGKAVRIWLTEYMYDPTMPVEEGKKLPKDLGKPSGDGTVTAIFEYSELSHIGDYISTNLYAKSLLDKDGKNVQGHYCVFLTADPSDYRAKIVIAVCPEGGADATKTNIAGVKLSEVTVAYDGKESRTENGAGVAYVEP